MNPAHSPYESPNTVLSFDDRLPTVDSYHWLLSILERVANEHISLETEKVTACPEFARWVWHVEVESGNDLALAAALEKMAAAIRELYATQPQQPENNHAS